MDGTMRTEALALFIKTRQPSSGLVAQVTNENWSPCWGVEKGKSFGRNPSLDKKGQRPLIFDPYLLPWLLIMPRVHKIPLNFFVSSNDLPDESFFAIQAGFNKAPNWYLEVCSENETDAAEGGCGCLCRRKSHFAFRTGRRQAAGRSDFLWSPVSTGGFNAYC